MNPDSTQRARGAREHDLPLHRDIAGIVLAAGAGTRFGSAKVLAPLYGKPLLGHVLEAAEGSFGRLVVVLGARSAELREHLAGYHIDSVVNNDRWTEGLSTSLQSGVAACEGFCSVVVLLAD